MYIISTIEIKFVKNLKTVYVIFHKNTTLLEQFQNQISESQKVAKSMYP